MSNYTVRVELPDADGDDYESRELPHLAWLRGRLDDARAR